MGGLTNNLGTEEIVTRGKAGGDCEREVSTVVVQDLCSPEVGVVGWHAHLVDLEPTSLVAGSTGSIVHLGHVDVDGAVVISLKHAYMRYESDRIELHLHQWPRWRTNGHLVVGASRRSGYHQLDSRSEELSQFIRENLRLIAQRPDAA